jgi:hypothetical protein
MQAQHGQKYACAHAPASICRSRAFRKNASSRSTMLCPLDTACCSGTRCFHSALTQAGRRLCARGDAPCARGAEGNRAVACSAHAASGFKFDLVSRAERLSKPIVIKPPVDGQSNAQLKNGTGLRGTWRRVRQRIRKNTHALSLTKIVGAEQLLLRLMLSSGCPCTTECQRNETMVEAVCRQAV